MNILDQINLIDLEEDSPIINNMCEDNYCDCDRYDGCDDDNYIK